MATNLIQQGDVIPYVNGTGSDIASGDFVPLTAFGGGVALVDIADDDTGSVALTGVWTLAKKTTEVFAQGCVLYWDATNEYLTTTSTDNTAVGGAFRSALAADTTAELRLGSPRITITIEAEATGG